MNYTLNTNNNIELNPYSKHEMHKINEKLKKTMDVVEK